MVEKEKIQMRKRNMKLFPIYKTLSWDYIFFYTTNFLFLTQCKHIHPADVVLIDSFYALFGIIMQVPATFVIEYLGRKKSMIFANFLNCIYMLVVMFSTNLFNLITAELLSSLAFGIKESVDPALLNESIPPSRYKSQIYSKISSKGASEFYFLDAVSKAVAGILFTVNAYLPIILSLLVLIIVTVLSIGFIEPIKKKKKGNAVFMYKVEMKNVKEGFAFVLKSERLKALILCAALIYALLQISSTYNVSLEENIGLSSVIIGIIAAIGGIISSLASKYQNQFHNDHHY